MYAGADRRIVALIDMDCFYVQVEQRRRPELRGRPCAVVQYNAWQGGSLIAVSYEARARGVQRRRGMRGEDARRLCPDIELITVPVQRGKADLTLYRDAGAEVIRVLSSFSGACVERASVDEAYVDLTDCVQRRLNDWRRDGEASLHSRLSAKSLSNTHVVAWDDEPTDDTSSVQDKESKESAEQQSGNDLKEDKERKRVLLLNNWLSQTIHSDDNFKDQIVDSGSSCALFDASSEQDYSSDLRLAVAALITEEMRAAVKSETQFNCSAGVSHNKMLAKLVCAFNKPNAQTVLPRRSVNALLRTLPLTKLRFLGGKLGASLTERLGARFVSDLWDYSEQQLVDVAGSEKSAQWLHAACRGYDNEPVRSRTLPKSIGCSKQFTGTAALSLDSEVNHWVKQLAEELEERLCRDQDSNSRVAQTLTVIYKQDNDAASTSRNCSLHRYDACRITNDVKNLLPKTSLNRSGSWDPPFVYFGLSASKFKDTETSDKSSIKNFFNSKTECGSPVNKNKENVISNSINSSDQLNSTKQSSVDHLIDISKSSLNHAHSKKGSPKKNKLMTMFKKIAESSACKEDNTRFSKDNCLNTSTSELNCKTEGKFDVDSEQIPGDVYHFDNSDKINNSKNKITAKASDKALNTAFNCLENNLQCVDNSMVTTCPGENSLADDENSSLNVCKDEEQEASTSNSLFNIPFKNSRVHIEPSESTNLETDSNIDSSLYEICEECGDKIPVWSLPEHLDFHVAQRFQREQDLQDRLEANERLDERKQTLNCLLKNKTNSCKRKSLANEKQSRNKKKCSDDSKMTKINSYFSSRIDH